MKQFFLVVTLCLAALGFAVAATPQATLIPVRHHRDPRVQKHHAHKATKHHTPKRPHHQGV